MLEVMYKQVGLTNDQINYLKNGAYEEKLWNDEQVEEIRNAINDGVDPLLWLDHEYSYEQMREFRLASKEGIDYIPYLNPLIDSNELKNLRLNNSKELV